MRKRPQFNLEEIAILKDNGVPNGDIREIYRVPYNKVYTALKKIGKFSYDLKRFNLEETVNSLVEMFEYFREHRAIYQTFYTGYISEAHGKDSGFKDKFGTLGMRIHANSVRYGGMKKFIKLAIKQKPEIKDYTTSKSVLKIDGPRLIAEMFDYFKEHRSEGQVFCTGYISHAHLNDKKFKEKFGLNGQNLYARAYKNLGEGGMQSLIDLAAGQRPEIKGYSTPPGVLKIDGLKLIAEMFDYFKEHRFENQIFNINYITNTHKQDNKFKEKFGKRGQNLYGRCMKNIGSAGMRDIVDLATEQIPEMKNYFTIRDVLKVDGPRLIAEMFDYFKEHRSEGQVFCAGYVSDTHLKDKQFKERFGIRGQNLYARAFRNLGGAGGIQQIIDFTAEQKPEMKDYITPQSALKVDGPRLIAEMFDYFKEHREENRMFNISYITDHHKEDKRFYEIFGKRGQNLYMRSVRNMGIGGMKELIDLAVEHRPEMQDFFQYGRRRGVK